MDSSRGVASRTRSRTRLSRDLSRETEATPDTEKDDVVFVEEYMNIESDDSSSSSSPDGFECRGESSGNSHDGRVCHTPMDIGPGSHHSYELRKRKTNQMPQEDEIIEISEVEFVNSRKHDRDADQEAVAEIESSADRMNEAQDNDDITNEESAPSLEVESNSSFSSSSESEDDDSDDEDFTVADSQDYDSMDTSSSYEEESHDHVEMEVDIEDLGGYNDAELSRNEEDSFKKKSKISVDASYKDNQDEVEVEVDPRGEYDAEPSRGEEDSCKKKSKISVDASCKENQDEVEVEAEEVGGDSDERIKTNHNGLENGVRSKIEYVLLSKTEETERISKTGEAHDLKASKMRGTEDLLLPNRTRDTCSEIPQRKRKRNFSSTENGKKLCMDESNTNKKRKDAVEDDHSPIGRGGFSRSNTRKTSELDEDNEDGGWTPRNEHLTKKCASTRKDHSFCEEILDSVLDDETDDEEAEHSCDHEDCLPLKFRFEDEVPKPVEKSEFEIMTDGLFEEMNLCLMYGDVDFSEQQKEVEKDNDADSEDGEMTQYERCCKGKHYLIEDDEYNIICKYCFHIEKEARDIIPPWVERMHHGTKKTSSGADPFSSILNELDMQKNRTNSHVPTEGTIWDIKPGTKKTMYQHQQEGLEFLWKNLAGTVNLADLKKTSEHSRSIGGCIISHAPGTGKTRLTMVFIETFLKVFPCCRPLIIAPASMLLTWEQEFKKWEVEFPFHNLNSLEISNIEDHHKAMENLGVRKSLTFRVRHLKIHSWNQKRSILGMSYQLFEILAGEKSKSEKLKRILLEKPGLVVLDEGHTPRNRKSHIWNTLLKLKTEKRIILSGTPFQNNFQELFNILRIVRPQIAGDLEKEKTFAEMMKYKRSRENARASEHEIEELKKVMEPFVHVHKGTILQQSLPGLRDCAVLLDPLPLQKDLIKRLGTLKCQLEFEFMVALLAVHPYLFNDCKTTKRQKEGVDLQALEASKLDPTEGVKTRFVMELVRLSALRYEKVLVFSQYIKPLGLINLHLEKTFGWIHGKHILTMKGEMSQKTRQELINSFNDPNSDAKVLLASTKCCSEGINLVGASRVVLLDVVWNPSVERQATCRAYRLGQKKIVYTYHLMTQGTPEWEKFCRQAEKERLSELVFTSSSNENCKITNCDDVGIEDGVLEDMVADVKMKDILAKIIYRPKENRI